MFLEFVVLVVFLVVLVRPFVSVEEDGVRPEVEMAMADMADMERVMRVEEISKA